eukprot:jgi/Botrbrau1/16580/Bobra.0068s0011.1
MPIVMPLTVLLTILLRCVSGIPNPTETCLGPDIPSDSHATAARPYQQGSSRTIERDAAGSACPKGDVWRRTLVCPRTAWSDLYRLRAVVQVDAPISALHVVMASPKSVFVAVGDQGGSLYLFNPDGRLALEHNTGMQSAVTAVASHRQTRNSSVVVAGHSNGQLSLLTIVYEGPTVRRGRHAADLEIVAWSAEARLEGGGEEGGLTGREGASIRLLQPFRRGVRREYGYAAADSDGIISIWSSHGSLVSTAKAPAPVLLLRAAFTHVTMLTSQGLATLPLEKDSPGDPKMEVHACWEGPKKLGPLAGAAWLLDTFGVASASRAYAVSEDGRLLLLSFGHRDKQNSCKVQWGVSAGLPGGGLEVAGTQGSLLIARAGHLWLYNVTLGVRLREPRLLLQQRLSDLSDSAGLTQAKEADPATIATSGMQLTAVALGGGRLALYRNLAETERPDFSQTPFLLRPVVLILMFVAGIYTFSRVWFSGGGGAEYSRQDLLGGVRSAYGRLDMREDTDFMRGVRAEMMERMERDSRRGPAPAINRPPTHFSTIRNEPRATGTS